MAIRAAIFDCDGTLLDSMPMWTSTCVALLERYGVEDAHGVFSEHESLDMDKKCSWYHNNLGIGTSGEALYRELWDMVADAYNTEVVPYEGCEDFLRSLARQRIPCVVVSSTPTELVRRALARHGLLEYFAELIFVGDVGRNKQHPDCYLAACSRLGVPREETWVFEDAPFAVRSATRAGFPTVAILNDHDGRDEGFLHTWATVVARSYAELSPERLHALGPRVLRALVVAGSPEPSSPELVRELVGKSDLVIAADKGIDVLQAAGAVPHMYCGDEDSASSCALEWAQAANVRFERHPKEKDDTDLGLAIALARRKAESVGAALRLTLTCASGGRPDHALGVLGQLARNANVHPRLVEDNGETRVLSPRGKATWRFCNEVGRTVSVIALEPHTLASERGMRWNLNRAALEPLDDLGISNRITERRACVTCHAGALYVYVHNTDKA